MPGTRGIFPGSREGSTPHCSPVIWWLLAYWESSLLSCHKYLYFPLLLHKLRSNGLHFMTKSADIGRSINLFDDFDARPCNAMQWRVLAYIYKWITFGALHIWGCITRISVLFLWLALRCLSRASIFSQLHQMGLALNSQSISFAPRLPASLVSPSGTKHESNVGVKNARLGTSNDVEKREREWWHVVPAALLMHHQHQHQPSAINYQQPHQIRITFLPTFHLYLLLERLL